MILVVRHGETPGNARRFVQTPATPLSDVGMYQAERVAERLREHGVARILSSDLRRAAMTADAIAARTGAPIDYTSLLQERNFGELRGMPYEVLEGDPFRPDYIPPGGESWNVFHARVDSAWRRIRATAGETDGPLVVVTHGFVCYSLALRHLALPPGAGASWRIGNTAVTFAEKRPPHTVTRLSCTAHLDDAASTGSAA